MSKAENHQRQRAEASEAAYQHALRVELERRIGLLAATSATPDTSDDTFGRMGLGDGVLVVALFLVTPALVIWICR